MTSKAILVGEHSKTSRQRKREEEEMRGQTLKHKHAITLHRLIEARGGEDTYRLFGDGHYGDISLMIPSEKRFELVHLFGDFCSLFVCLCFSFSLSSLHTMFFLSQNVTSV